MYKTAREHAEKVKRDPFYDRRRSYCDEDDVKSALRGSLCSKPHIINARIYVGLSTIEITVTSTGNVDYSWIRDEVEDAINDAFDDLYAFTEHTESVDKYARKSISYSIS